MKKRFVLPRYYFYLWICFSLTACDKGSVDSNQRHADKTADMAVQRVALESPSLVSRDPAEPPAQLRTKIIGSGSLPYPIYPNGSRYHVGGENGLKVVLYQTSDSFEQVDQFYKTQAAELGMPRLAAMTDYVRYAISGDDMDPWDTTKPGIVIHQFNGTQERVVVGADQNAVTNIIMSF
ncbi:MAG: hypothetical protein KTR32_04080 [Granulosicoccus sp.]|nr:hypothetical protein [Granulosicoccus sp.]